jgi:hypothetical protein
MGKMFVEKSIEVNAPVREVWDRVLEVSTWPEWKPFIRKASIGGGYDSLSNGSSLKFSLFTGGPAAVPLSVKITEFDIPNRLAWEGGVRGLVHAVHSFEFKDVQGKTLVISREEFTGGLLWAMKLMMSQQDLEKLHEQWVQAIKQRVEKQPAK